jgi:hypothetical protein
MLANATAQRNRVMHTLAAMRALGDRLSLVPGRKNLIWLTAGFSMTSITGKIGFGTRGTVESYEDKVRDCAKKLAQYGVTLYIVNADMLQGLPELDVTAPPSLPGRPGGRGGRFDGQVQTAALSSDPLLAMHIMSKITGGRYLYNSNDLTQGFIEAANDLRGSYTLGFYTVEEPDGQWHSLKVKVKRSGVRLRHREGYIAEIQPAAPPDSDTWRTAALSGIGSSSIPLSAICKARNDEIEVDIRIDVTALDLRKQDDQLVSNLVMVFADRSADGSSRETTFRGAIRISEDRLQAAIANGFQYLHSWTPAAEVVQTRIVVHDPSTGKYGTLDLPVCRIRGER